MSSGRVLVVHESGATRALLLDLLARAGLDPAGAESSYDAMGAFVDEPSDLVLLGLAGMDERELAIIPALKREEKAPRILVCFPSPRRDLAVQALALGADGYVLEPFYGDEIVNAVRGMMREGGAGAAAPAEGLARLAGEVAHAVNNPLQVLALLLAKDKVTKRELVKGVPEQAARIEAVVKELREFAREAEARPSLQDPRPAVEASRFRVEAGEPGTARIDAALLTAALDAIHGALAARAGEPLDLRMEEEEGVLALTCSVPREAFRGEDPAALADEVFVVTAEREVRPGLARARRLLESMGGSLQVEVKGSRVRFSARVPR